jgi:2-polyprenyl-3-methyl-5-hydroxy-6-metoxy-1,4-benzoquinol methylase
MTNHTSDATPSKSEKVAGLSFLLLIITIILKWIRVLIKGEKVQQMNKSEKFWDMIANGFDDSAVNFEQTHIKTVASAKKYLKKSDIVLDYGCATGTVAIEIADSAKTIHGIDISSRMIEAAKRKANEHKIKNVDFMQSTIFEEFYLSESFDVILAFNILHVLEDTPKVVKRIHELLKPGGLFISATECMGERTSFITILVFLLSKTGILPYFRFFKVSELEGSIADGNFQIVETESFYNQKQRQPNHFIAAKKL